MEITFLGYIAIIVTIIALILKNADILLYAAIFCCGFTGASVANFETTSLQPAFYFLILYLICYFVGAILKMHPFEVKIDKILAAFFVYSLVSIVFPVLFGGKDVIVLTQAGKYAPLAFSMSNIVHIGYLFFDLLFLNVLLSTGDKRKRGIYYRCFKWGFYAVVLICMYQYVAFRFDLPFDVLFRQGVHGNVQGDRLYGPCIEASMLCYYLVPVIFVILQSKPKIWDYFFVAMAIIVGALTMSSTFLVGMILLILCAIPSIVSSLRGKHSSEYWLVVMLIPLFALLLLALFWRDVSGIFEAFIDKLHQRNESGMVRTTTFKELTMLGLQYPLGLGFGSSRGNDLFSTWLCNVGVVGMLIFIVFVVKYTVTAAREKRLLRALPFVVTVILMMISVPEPYNLFVWYILYYGYTGVGKVRSASSVRGNRARLKKKASVGFHAGKKAAAVMTQKEIQEQR